MTARSAIGRILGLLVVDIEIQGRRMPTVLAEVEIYQARWCVTARALTFDLRTLVHEFVTLMEIGEMRGIGDHPTDADLLCALSC